MMYAQANNLLRKFSVCTDGVKMALFKHLWLNYRKRLKVAYNDAMRILLKRPRLRWCSASEIFVPAGVNTLQTVLRNLGYKCIC